VRRLHSRQWQTETRIGSPLHRACNWPQEQPATRSVTA